MSLTNLDFSYVNPQSPEYLRFQAWAKPALTGAAPYGFDVGDAVILYLFSPEPQKSQWATKAIALTELAVKTAEANIAAGLNPPVAKDKYLHVGAIIGDLALTYAYFNDRLTESQKTRWAAYAEQALTNVWNPKGALDYWGSKGTPGDAWATEDPGNNYHYSFLHATIFWGFANSPKWIQYLRDNKWPALVAYYKQNGVGGGSREGTGYGVAHGSLFALYDAWKALANEDLAKESSHVVDTILYWAHATLPDWMTLAPIGDWSRQAYPWIYDYHRGLVLRARKVAGNTWQADVATWWLNRSMIKSGTNNVKGRMSKGENSAVDLLPVGTTERAPTSLYHYSPGAGHLFARSDWTPLATWFGVIAGIYDQAHQHEDQGSFLLWREGFLSASPNMYSTGLRQTTEHHNTLRFEIAGVIQGQFTKDVTKRSVAKLHVIATNGHINATATELESMYKTLSRIRLWNREFTFGDGSLDIHDHFITEGTATVAPAEAVFQLNVIHEPVWDGNTILAGNMRITILIPQTPKVTFLDWTKVVDVTGKGYSKGWRIDIRGGVNEYRVKLDTFSLSAEDPDMIKELQEQIAALTLTVSKLQTEKTALEAKVTTMGNDIAALNTRIIEQQMTLDEQALIIQSHVPLLQELQELQGVMKVINRY